MGYLASSLEISQFLLTELRVTFFFLKRALDKNVTVDPTDDKKKYKKRYKKRQPGDNMRTKRP